jgi:diguanylate cyclase (GGDEF)-like protein/PAS domain S-box-containing protein
MNRGFFPADDHTRRRRPEPIFASSQKRMIALVALIGTIGWTSGLLLLLGHPTPEAGPSAVLTLAGITLASTMFLFAVAPTGFARRMWSERRYLAPAIGSDLKRSVDRLEAALNNMAQGLVMFDAHERIVICNDLYVRMYGLSRDVVKPGCLLLDLLRHRIETGGCLNLDPEQYRRDLLGGLARGGITSMIVKTAQGREVLVKNSPMPAGGWVATHEDITDRRRTEAQIAYMANHDALTGLFNRSRFQQELQCMLARQQRADLAALCLDLDRFKEVNDALGHHIGDLLIEAVAVRLRNCVRETDIIARLGGDEFAILQVGATQPRDAALLASRLLDSVGAPYELEGHQVVIGLSIGIALAPVDGPAFDTLLRSADLALYRAKIDGRGLYRFFEPEMDARMKARRSLEVDLRNAVAEGLFELFYQPIVNVLTQQISGFEALVRWRHPSRGLLAPAEFLSVADETGLAAPLGNWILRQACMEAAEWPADIRVAVNLSPMQFRDKGFISTVKSALTASGLAPGRLQLEITEAILALNGGTTLAVLGQLRELGIRIAMDDFGTGGSILSYLRKFPFDSLKINQTLFHDASDHDDSLAIVRAIVAMGNGLCIGTIAEGIETREQLERLKTEGCSEMQGYLFSPPRPAEEVTAWLSTISPISLAHSIREGG